MLTAVLKLCETIGEYVETQQVLNAFPTEEHGAVLHSLRRLDAHGYIKTLTSGPTLGNSRVHILKIKRVTEKG